MRTDASLMAAARSEPSAFREIYDRYAERVFGYHLRRVAHRETAHDLTAETFARVWSARTRFRDEAGGSAGPWIFAIARHVLVASVRKRALEVSVAERLGLTLRAVAEPDDTWLDDVDELLQQLPPAQRDAIRLRVVDDLSYDSVARQLDTTSQAARVRVHRGLATLRQRLTDVEEPTR